MSQDVAAATFMSFATCTPEFFTILIGTFITETDIGIGAVVGSGMFNILGVATCGGLAAAKVKIYYKNFRIRISTRKAQRRRANH